MIGVLTYQGDFQKHVDMLRSLGESVVPIRGPEQIPYLKGLVIPGGESTTIGKLMDRFAVLSTVRAAIDDGLAVMGTCAGAILLAKTIEGSEQERIGSMNVSVRRNAYGRQINSFEAAVDIPVIGGEPFEGVFIRAPMITGVGDDVDVLSEFEGSPVIVRQQRLLALTFHPELTGDSRIHQYFTEIVTRSG